MIAAIWARFSKWIIAAGGLLLSFVAFYWRGRKAGKQAAEKEVQKRDAEEAKAHAETIREVADAQSNVVRLPDDAVRERLSERWTRKAD